MRVFVCCFVVVAAVCSFAGCPDLSVPAGESISCSSDDDCPRDTRCEASAQLCVPRAGDGAPPKLIEALLSTTTASASTAVTLSLRADAPLLRAPDVRLLVGEPAVAQPFVVVESSGDHETSTYAFTPSNTLASGAWPLVATLLGVDGEVAVDVAVGDLTLDFAAPQAVSVVADADFAAAGDVVHVVVAFDEGVAGVVANVGGRDIAVVGAGASAEFDVDNDAGDVEGAVAVRVHGVDAAGNAGADREFADVYFRDFTAPVVVDAPAAVALRAVARRGELAGAAFRSSEPLDVLPTAVATRAGGPSLSLAVSADVVDPQSLTATLVVPDGAEMPDGDYVVSLSGAKDRAQNPGLDVGALVTFAVDNDGPIISSISHPPVVGVGEVVVFCDVEDGDGPPTATLGDRGPVVCTPGGAACDDVGSCFKCTFTVDADDRDTGLVNVTISATDGAGNTAFESSSIEIDVAPPVVVAATASAAAYKDGDTVVVRVDVDGPLRRPLDLRQGLRCDRTGQGRECEFPLPAGCFDDVQAPNATGFTFRCAARDLVGGRFHFELGLLDRADNSAVVVVGSADAPVFVVDADAPRFERTPPIDVCRGVFPDCALESRVSLADGFHEGFVRFVANEVVGDGAVVFVGDDVIACDFDDSNIDRGQVLYVCPFDVRALSGIFTGEFVRPLLVVVADAAGNSVDASGLLTIDTQPVRQNGNATISLLNVQNPLVDVEGSVAADGTVTVGVGTRLTARVPLSESGGAVRKIVAVPRAAPSSPVTICSDPSSCLSGGATAFIETTLAPTAAAPNGPWDVHLDVDDGAGNVSDLVVSVVVDTAAPAPPDPARLQLLRTPLGDRFGGSNRSVTVNADVGVLEGCGNAGNVLVPCDRVVAFSAPRGGTLLAASDDAFHFVRSLPLPTDRANVWLAAVDVAGNVSPRLKVVRSDWTVTLNDKQPQSTLENPSTLTLTSNFRSGFRQDSAASVEPDDLRGGYVHDDDAVSGVGRGAFVDVDGDAVAPDDLVAADLAYDNLRGVIVIVGDDGGDTVTVEFDVDDRRFGAPVRGGPPRRSGPALGFDPLRGRVVLFGGDGPSSSLQDTWEWDGSRWTRKAIGGPPPTSGGRLLFTRRSKTLVLVGGGVEEPGAPTWRFDGRAWTPIATAHQVTPRRKNPSVGVDDLSGDVYVIGGDDGDGPLRDTWVFDGADWQQLSTTTPPPALSDATLLRDDFGLVLLGGSDATGANSAQFRLSDGAARDWFDAGARAVPSTLKVIADPALHGAVGLERRGRQLFRLENQPGWSALSNATDTTVPRPKLVAPLASDPVHGGVIDARGHRCDHDLTRFDGDIPDDLLPQRPALAVGGGGVFAFGGFRDGLVVDELWFYDGDGWTEQPRTAIWPPARADAAVAFDAARDVLVVVGGSASGNGRGLDDVWEFSDGAFVDKTPPGDAFGARTGAAAVFFGGSVVVFFGEHDASGLNLGAALDEVLRWNGSAFTAIGGAHPPARAQLNAVVDSRRGEVLLFGGSVSAANGARDGFDDLWSFDGAAFVEHDDVVVPTRERQDAGAAYDAQSDSVVIVDGDRQRRFARRAAAVWSVPVLFAGAGDAEPVGMAVRLFGGVQQNTLLSLWNAEQQRWSSTFCFGDGVDEDFCAVGGVDSFDVDPRPLLTGSARTVTLALTPRLPVGDDEVAFDAGAVSIRFAGRTGRAATFGAGTDLAADGIDVDNCGVGAIDGVAHLDCGAGTARVVVDTSDVDPLRFPRVVARFATGTATAARLNGVDVGVIADGLARAYEVAAGAGDDAIVLEVDDGGFVDVDLLLLTD